MDNQKFNRIVSSDRALEMLINQQTYGVRHAITRTTAMTPEFIDWVSPKYYDSFKNIYDRNKNKNPGTIAAVVNECFLGNPEVHEALALLFLKNADQLLTASTKYLKSIRILKEIAAEEFPNFKVAIDDLSLSAIRSIDTAEMREKREQFTENLLEMTQILAEFSKSRSPKEFQVYEKLNTILKSLKLDPKQRLQVAIHEKRINKKNTWYIVGAALFILFIIIKWTLRFSQ